jgi:hypothetical protein
MVNAPASNFLPFVSFVCFRCNNLEQKGTKKTKGRPTELDPCLTIIGEECERFLNSIGTTFAKRPSLPARR